MGRIHYCQLEEVMLVLHRRESPSSQICTFPTLFCTRLLLFDIPMTRQAAKEERSHSLVTLWV